MTKFSRNRRSLGERNIGEAYHPSSGELCSRTHNQEIRISSSEQGKWLLERGIHDLRSLSKFRYQIDVRYTRGFEKVKTPRNASSTNLHASSISLLGRIAFAILNHDLELSIVPRSRCASVNPTREYLGYIRIGAGD